VSDISGSEMNKSVDTFGTNDVIDARLRLSVTVDCREIVAFSLTSSY